MPCPTLLCRRHLQRRIRQAEDEAGAEGIEPAPLSFLLMVNALSRREASKLFYQILGACRRRGAAHAVWLARSRPPRAASARRMAPSLVV